MKCLIDTSALIDHVCGEDWTARWILSGDTFFIPFTVVAEIESGFRSTPHPDRNRQLFDELLYRSDNVICFPTVATIDAYAEIRSNLRKAGEKIPTNDIWIAAQALELGLDLLTSDRHFLRVDGLKLRAPWL